MRQRRRATRILAAGLAVLATVAALRALDGSSDARPLIPGERVAARVAAGDAALARAGAEADSRHYLASERAFRQALALDPDNFHAVSGLGRLALARHRFTEALRLGRRARRINPTVASNYGVLVDAQVELGRYRGAERSLRRWLGLDPGFAAYARVSYFRELHGDLEGAVSAMRLAAISAGEASPDFPYLQALVGDLRTKQGRYAAAERAYRTALARNPEAPDALAGLAAIATARGRDRAALAGYRRAFRALPTAGPPQAIGEIHEAAGRHGAARRAYRRAERRISAERPNGVDVDAELAAFLADRGHGARAVKLGRRAWGVRPSVVTADAYAWALHVAGRDAAALQLSREATRLGSKDPLGLYRAGAIAAAAGAEGRAARFLRASLERTPRFNPLHAPRAAALLAGLGAR